MESIQLPDLIGWAFGVIGLVYAWYQHRERKRLKDIGRAEAWNLYQSANSSCGKIQKALKMYKNLYAKEIQVEFLEELAKADASSLETYLSTIRHIQMVEPNFDIKTIDYWVESNKIPQQQWGDFRKIAIDQDISTKSKYSTKHSTGPA